MNNSLKGHKGFIKGLSSWNKGMPAVNKGKPAFATRCPKCSHFIKNNSLHICTYIENPSTKCCTKCKIDKPLESFNKSKRTRVGYHPVCKECTAKIYIDRNYAKLYRQWDSKNREKIRFYKMKNRHGVTEEQYRLMLFSQDSKCYGCQLEFGPALKPYIDHCHSTGKIRGLLCRECNLLLGHARDNPNTLSNLIKYLNK